MILYNENSASNMRGMLGGNMVCLGADNVARGVYKALKALNAFGVSIPGSGADSSKGEMMKEIFLNLEVADPFSGYCVPKCIIAAPSRDVEIITGMEGLIDYEREFIDGTRDDDSELFGYTYHKLYEEHYPKMIDTLKAHKYTRQAVLPVGAGGFYNVENDKPCLTELIFKVRSDGRLWCTAMFRSNDAVRAFPMNIWAIARLLKHVAHQVDIPCGGINYIANSFHVYPGCDDTLKGYVARYDTNPPYVWAWTEEEYITRKFELMLETEDI